MRHPKLPGLLLLASAIALTGCTDSSSDDAPKPDYRLAILHINDHHSNLDESDASLRLRTGSDDTRTACPSSSAASHASPPPWPSSPRATTTCSSCTPATPSPARSTTPSAKARPMPR